MTNGDRIREMSDEELAVIIMCPYDIDQDMCICDIEMGCIECSRRWLEEEVGEAEVSGGMEEAAR